MSTSQRWNLKKIFTTSRGCGCGQKATDIIEPKPKSQTTTTTTTTSDQKITNCAASSSTGSWQPIIDDEGYYTSTTLSLNIDGSSPQFCSENRDHPECSKSVTTPCPKIHDSLAVVKDSDDPYLDFRQSMLQMIFEREIYSSDDLQQLLQCFLQLNSPHHHEVIVQAFMEIWNGGVAGGEEDTPPCSTSNKST